MDLAKSQEQIMSRLKIRGPQSVKILSNQLGMTTMGIRLHLAEMKEKNLVTQTKEEKQIRGRPVHLWRLTETGPTTPLSGISDADDRKNLGGAQPDSPAPPQ